MSGVRGQPAIASKDLGRLLRNAHREEIEIGSSGDSARIRQRGRKEGRPAATATMTIADGVTADGQMTVMAITADGEATATETGDAETATGIPAGGLEITTAIGTMASIGARRSTLGMQLERLPEMVTGTAGTMTRTITATIITAIPTTAILITGIGITMIRIISRPVTA